MEKTNIENKLAEMKVVPPGNFVTPEKIINTVDRFFEETSKLPGVKIDIKNENDCTTQLLVASDKFRILKSISKYQFSPNIYELSQQCGGVVLSLKLINFGLPKEDPTNVISLSIINKKGASTNFVNKLDEENLKTLEQLFLSEQSRLYFMKTLGMNNQQILDKNIN